MLDTPTASPDHRKEPVATTPGDDNTLRSPDGPDSVEALEEALATARVRLQERLTGEIEAQRHELERLKAEGEQRSAEANATMVQAKETAERMLREASEAADRVRREGTEASEQLRRETTATAVSTLSQAQATARTMLTQLKDGADAFFTMAATQIETVEQALGSASAESKKEAAEPTARGIDESESISTASEPAAQGIVTRLIVRPLVGANTRLRIKERFEGIAGVQAVKSGPTGDESFEMLVIHSREAKVSESVLAVAPDEIVLRDQKVGYLEIELKDMAWLGKDAEAGSRSA